MSKEALRRIEENKKTKATSLDLSRCGIFGGLPSELAELTWLEELNLSFNKISSPPTHPSPENGHPLAPLAGLKALQTLWLDNTQVADIAPLAGLKALQMLSLFSTQIGDIAPLAGLKALKELWLDNTQVADIAPLAGLKALKELWLHNTQVADIAPLAGLRELQTLWLDNTKVANIAPLAGLRALQQLSLDYTQVADLSPLLELIKSGLTYSVAGSPITHPPIDIVEKGRDAVIDYLERGKSQGLQSSMFRSIKAIFETPEFSKETYDQISGGLERIHLFLYESTESLSTSRILGIFQDLGFDEPKIEIGDLFVGRPPSGPDMVPQPVPKRLAMTSDGSMVEVPGRLNLAATMRELRDELTLADIQSRYTVTIVVECEGHSVPTKQFVELIEAINALHYRVVSAFMKRDDFSLEIGPITKGSAVVTQIINFLWGNSEKVAASLGGLAIIWKAVAAVIRYCRRSQSIPVPAQTNAPAQPPPSSASPGAADQALMGDIARVLRAAASIVLITGGPIHFKDHRGQVIHRIEPSDLDGIHALQAAYPISVNGFPQQEIVFIGPKLGKKDMGEFHYDHRTIEAFVHDAAYNLANLPKNKLLIADLDRVLCRAKRGAPFMEDYWIVRNPRPK